MFSKVSKSESKTSASSGSGRSLSVPKFSSAGVAPSIVSANLRVTGDLESEGDIQIDGHVEGDVRSNSVTVGEHAVVSGAIIAQTVHVAGTVKGQINGKTVELARTAKVTGDIVHESLAIEAGAFIQGLCRHADSAVQPVKPMESNGHDRPMPKEVPAANLVAAQNGSGMTQQDDDKTAKSALAASAAKGQEAIKKVFR
jgi:cytoskeletal protein CcmA (bactofilin family)